MEFEVCVGIGLDQLFPQYVTIEIEEDLKSKPQPSEKWLHYKGGVYQIICMSKHTETNEELVIYTSDKSEQVFARPYSHWHEIVSKDDYGFPIARFRKIN